MDSEGWSCLSRQQRNGRQRAGCDFCGVLSLMSPRRALVKLRSSLHKRQVRPGVSGNNCIPVTMRLFRLVSAMPGPFKRTVLLEQYILQSPGLPPYRWSGGEPLM